MQYCIISLYCAELPGNRFFNGVLFGVSETISMFFSGMLLDRMFDMHALYVVYALGVASYAVFIFFPTAGLHTYLANMFAITSITSTFNIQLLILEMRVPPQNVGSVSLLTRTLAVGFGVFSPTIATFPEPWPYICLLSVATIGFVASLFLPEPGHHLPHMRQTGDNSVLVVDKATDQATLVFNNSVMTANFVKHNMSFNQSFTERAIGVVRPHMNESRLDPETYLQANYAEQIDINKFEHSLILREWLAPMDDDQSTEKGVRKTTM